MLLTILYIIGLILAIKAAIEIAKLKGNLILKILFIVLVLCTSCSVSPPIISASTNSSPIG